MMKIILLFVCVYFLTGCSLFRRNIKYGCPTNGRNVGAEKIASGDPKSLKAASKAKWKGRKFAY